MSENIHQAINEVMKAVGYVKQTGTMQVQGHRYSYTSESDLIEALRPAMNEAGVICMPRSIVEMRQETYTTKGGSVMNRVTLLIQYAFVHAASGTELLCQTVGEGSDAGDKATAKAMTGALKYALRQTFLIETGDDPDKGASSEQERASSNGKHSTTEGATAPPSEAQAASGKPTITAHVRPAEAIDIPTLIDWFQRHMEKCDAPHADKELTKGDRRLLGTMLSGYFPEDDDRHNFQFIMTGFSKIAEGMTYRAKLACDAWNSEPDAAEIEADAFLALTPKQLAELVTAADEPAAEEPAA
jgi:hypothetical protein